MLIDGKHVFMQPEYIAANIVAESNEGNNGGENIPTQAEQPVNVQVQQPVLSPQEQRKARLGEIAKRIPTKGKTKLWTQAKAADVAEYIMTLTDDVAKQQATVQQYIDNIKEEQAKLGGIEALELDEDIAFWEEVNGFLTPETQTEEGATAQAPEVTPVTTAENEAQPIAEVTEQQPVETTAAQTETEVNQPVGISEQLNQSGDNTEMGATDINVASKENVQLSDEVDENGRQFVLNSNGEIVFGEIAEDTGLTPAPILLSEGLITNPATNDGYGLVHIEARHGDQIRRAGYSSVVEFVEEVAKNYEVIREGKNRNGQQTYMLQLTDKHNNTLMVELSGDGTYWNINTAGIFKTSYGKNRKEVYNRHTTAKQPTETVEVSQDVEQSGTQTSSGMNTPTTSSDSKDTTNSQTTNELEEISLYNLNKSGSGYLMLKDMEALRKSNREEYERIYPAYELFFKAKERGLYPNEMTELKEIIKGTSLESKVNGWFTPVEQTQEISENRSQISENTQDEGEKDVIKDIREQNRMAEEIEQRAGVPPRPSDYVDAITDGDAEAQKAWEGKFDDFLAKLTSDDLPIVENTIRGMQSHKSGIKAGNPKGYKENPSYKAFDYIEKALKKRKKELENSSTTGDKSQEIEDYSTNNGEQTEPTISQESEQVSDQTEEEKSKDIKQQLLGYPNRDLKKLIKSIEEALPHYVYTMIHTTNEQEYAEAENNNKYYSLVLELAKDVLQERDSGNWKTDFGVKLSYNKELAMEDVRTLFEHLNGDKAVTELFEKVYAVAKTLGLKIKISDQLSVAAGNAGNDGMVKYAAALFYRSDINNQKKAETLLHELIHTCTMYATTLHKNKSAGGILTEMYDALPVEIKEACAELERIYDLVKDNDVLKGEYGISSVDEMVAELSNSKFREKLKQIGIWERIVNAIKKLFDFSARTDNQRESDALTEAERVLETMLDNFDKSTYDEVRNRLLSAGRGRKRSLLPNEELQQGSLTLDRENPAFKVATEETMNALAKTGVEVVMATQEQVNEVLGIADAERQMIENANERFNRELDAFKEKQHKGLLHLGRPMGILSAAGVNARELTVSPTVLHQHLKKHNLTTDDLKGLAEAVQTPILVYRHGETKPHVVIVTELDVDGGKLSIALRLDENGNVVEVSNVSSVHSKDAQTELERLALLDSDKLRDYLRWVEKEKVSDWLGLPYEEERQDANPKLVSVANVINDFENPKVSPEFHRVYHGSGAKFDRFDHSFMGSGEGAQRLTAGVLTLPRLRGLERVMRRMLLILLSKKILLILRHILGIIP